MPDGRTHDAISIVFLPILVAILYFIGLAITPIIIISAAYLFASFMFNGDLDIRSGPYRRWLFLKWIWLPYRNMIPHRSILSHGLIIGTVVRLLYLGIIPAVILYFNGFDFTILFNIETLYVLIGLECGSALHTISDKFF